MTIRPLGAAFISPAADQRARPGVLRYRIEGDATLHEHVAGDIARVVALIARRVSWSGDPPALRYSRSRADAYGEERPQFTGRSVCAGDLWEALVHLHLLRWITATFASVTSELRAPVEYFGADLVAISVGVLWPVTRRFGSKPSENRPTFRSFHLISATTYAHHPEVARMLERSTSPADVTLADAADAVIGRVY